MNDTAYLRACERAAREQGVDVVIAELASNGIEAALWQTGGFTMCFGIKVGDRWVQGNESCAAVFSTADCQPESMIETICAFDENGQHGRDVAQSVTNWMAKQVAKRFAERLREEIGDENYREVLRRNATPEYDGCCASHDFCDANMTMLAALEDCGIDDGADGPTAIWNLAWAAWRNGGAA